MKYTNVYFYRNRFWQLPVIEILKKMTKKTTQLLNKEGVSERYVFNILTLLLGITTSKSEVQIYGQKNCTQIINLHFIFCKYDL